MRKKHVIMVYPYQGFSGTYAKHMPLSLLYASAELVKADYDVVILDTRVTPGDWRKKLTDLIDADTLCVGVSAMSGAPIGHAREIGRIVKAANPGVAVVWGGPHATFYPESILRDEWSADYAVSGYASKIFLDLCEALREGRRPVDIPGITWRDGDRIHVNGGNDKSFEYIDYRDIPYHLIEDYSPYGQLDQDRRIFSMYSALGCPYQCTFCSSPAQYATIDGKKWVALKTIEVVDHIEHVVKTYGANYIYFIDDDSFPSLKHVEDIIDAIHERKLPVKLGFRGARINEIKKMSDAYLAKLARAGTDIMHIGAECGSDRLLQLLKKNCTVDDIVECNRKLARHPEITAAYNFIMGLPTETLNELKSTRDLMLRLVDDHPNCLIFPPNKFRPLPGTELYEVAQKEWGYSMPNTLDAWSAIEVEGEISDQWYEKGMAEFCNLMLISSYFIDNKVENLTEGTTLFYKVLRLINKLYRPIARYRLQNGLTQVLVEYWAYRVLTGVLSKLQARFNRISA
ncbi:MAG: B12-binding domain-containing radical SAM protein [Alphaproteobacteria bacterium]|nr:B12-binding domain-containing radical SAM protein [Alphaproteobacteria bacterium]MBF0249699.1 B12-binding domain-containing radical SAM protein [Alphaproteobacteria bacterium]